VENHHVDNQEKASPHQAKRAHSYSYNEEDHLHRPVQDGDSIYASFATPASKKSKKARRKTPQDGVPAENVICIPSFVNVLGMGIDQVLIDAQPINFKVIKLECITDVSDYHFKNRTFLKYDDDSSCQPPTLVETDSTDSSFFLLGALP